MADKNGTDISSQKSIPSWLKLLRSDVITGALGTSGACLVSTPPELIKTKLQLQGELTKAGAPKIYKGNFLSRNFRSHRVGTLHGTFVIIKNEGIRGLYRGVIPALWYQVWKSFTKFPKFQFIWLEDLGQKNAAT